MAPTKAARRSSAAPETGPFARVSERAALWLLVAILGWMQFPLGSNRPWAWSLLVMLIALDWALWIPAGLADGAIGGIQVVNE